MNTNAVNQQYTTPFDGAADSLNTKGLFCLFILLLSLLSSWNARASDEKVGLLTPPAAEKPLALTPDEKAWLREHPVIRLGFHPYAEPLLIKEDDGSLSGVFPDIFVELANILDIGFTIEVGDWTSMVQNARNREVDGLLACAPSQAEASQLLTTHPIHWTYPVAFTRQDADFTIQRLDNLRRKRIVYPRETRMLEIMLEDYRNTSEILPVDNTLDALTLILEEKADVAFTLSTRNYLVQKHALTGIKLAYWDLDHGNPVSTCIRDDWPELVRILNKGLDHLGPARIQEILAQWIGARPPQPAITLTPDERQWIEQHPEIRVGLPANMPPLSSLEKDGKPTGMFIDFFHIMADHAGLNFTFIPMTFPELTTAAQNRDIDLFTGFETDEQKQYMRFTNELYTLHYVIITRQGAPFIRGMSWLRGKKVSVLRNVAMHTYLERDEPEIELVPVDTILEGLKSVSTGRADAYIGVDLTAASIINREKIVNLKIAAPASYPDDAIRFGVRDDWPELVRILNKVIASVTPETHDSLINKWITIRYEHMTDWRTVGYWIAGISSVFGVILAMTLFWNRRLAKEINVRRQVEEKLAHAKEIAEAANLAKSEFLANMSHEIRTPLNAILGFTDILRGQVTDSQHTHYLETIHTSGKTLLSLLNDILDLSKVEAGKLRLEYRAVSLPKLFHDMRAVFEQRLQARGLGLIIDLAPELPDALLLDETRLRQILLNLIGNAVKFTETGAIRLSAHACYRGDTHSVVDLTLAVHDTGRGIPEAQQQIIFDAFSQVKGQKPSEFGGAGLGLAITRRLVELMNGTITIESDLGLGSTFTMLFHEVEVASTTAFASSRDTRPDLASITFEPATVLIADDIDYNRELIKGLLAEYSLTLLDARNGFETLELARQHQPDLILLDMKMPDMDGYTATREIRNVPIIAVTASALKQDEIKIRQHCDAYLRKPISKSALLSELMKFLPHTIHEQATAPEEIAQDLSAEVLAQHPDLLAILTTQRLRCKEVAGRMDIDEIEAFAHEIHALGSQYQCQPLANWANTLLSIAREFDSERISGALLNLQTIIDQSEQEELQ